MMQRTLALVLLLICPALFSQPVGDQLSKISLRDRVHMTYFFRDLYEKNQLGYVLLGDTKPCNYSVEILKFNAPQKHKNGFTSYKFKRKLRLRGWNAWKKHEHLFKHDNFIFSSKVRLFPVADASWERFDLYVINKSNLIACLETYNNIFKEILGSSFSCKTFIGELEEGAFIEDLIQGDEALKGILLGYPPSSTLSYKKRKLHQLSQDTTECQGIDVVSKINRRIYPIRWAGDPTQEDVEIFQEKYKADTEQIISQYDRKHALRFVLENLCK